MGKRTIIIIVAVMLLLTMACSLFSSEEDDSSDTIKALAATLTAVNAEEEIIPTETPVPTATQAVVPTNTRAPKESNDTDTTTTNPTVSGKTAKNWVGYDVNNDVEVVLLRILIAEHEAIENDFHYDPPYNDKETLIEFIFQITNNSDHAMAFPYFLTTATVNEQEVVSFSDFREGGIIGEPTKGLLPGDTIIGGSWVGIDQFRWDEVDRVTVDFPAAIDAQGNVVTQKYYFPVNVYSDWGFDPLPEELEN